MTRPRLAGCAPNWPCVDRRNGKTLYANTSSSSDNLMRIYAEPANKKMFVQMRRRRVELYFTDEPLPQTPNGGSKAIKPDGAKEGGDKKDAAKPETGPDLSVFRKRVKQGVGR